MNEHLLNQAHALCVALNDAGYRRAAVYAGIPYSVRRMEDDPAIQRIERLLTRAQARYDRRVKKMQHRQPKRTVITPDTLVSYLRERCPYCDQYTLYLEFDEWESESGAPTDSGTHVHCKNEKEDDPRDHSDMPYVYWLPVQQRAARWAAAHLVITERDDRKELAAWNEGRPIVVAYPRP